MTSLLLWLILALYVWICFASDGVASPCFPPPPPKPNPAMSGVKWFATRLFFFSNDAPMNRVLRRVDGFVENVDKAEDKITDIENNILNHLSQRMSQNEKVRSQRLDLCNLEDKAWQSAAKEQIEIRFPVTARIDCVTDFIPDPNAQRELYHIIYTFNRLMEKHAADMAREAGTNFTDADTIFDYPFHTATQTCAVNGLAAYRINATWYFNIAVSNAKKEKHLGEFQRFIIIEVMTRGGGYGNMTLPVRPPDGVEEEERQVRSDTTTIMASSRGTSKPSFFKPEPLEENVAVKQALSSLDLYTRQASDALSPSSITILFFPLWLNFVPIALLADVNSVTMLIYALLSDVLTALPLAIKGIELIQIGSYRSIGTVVRMSSGLNGTRSHTAATEVYVAECFAKDNVREKGIVFLTLALLFLVCGLVVECLGMRYKTQLRRGVFQRRSLKEKSWSGRRSSDEYILKGFTGTSSSVLEVRKNEDHEL